MKRGTRITWGNDRRGKVLRTPRNNEDLLLIREDGYRTNGSRNPDRWIERNRVRTLSVVDLLGELA